MTAVIDRFRTKKRTGKKLKRSPKVSDTFQGEMIETSLELLAAFLIEEKRKERYPELKHRMLRMAE
ncbi:hypothetical protein [Hyphomicrobium sp. 2TAF46]|uniref:hypothetical protein n=1 Tax=Hyphomicrobium sp. 2TAF46 TaxID=3233019 RepID=UPI003F92C0AE